MADIKRSFWVIAIALAIILPASVMAQQPYEERIVLDAEKALPPQMQNGPGFRVDRDVANDGFINHYRVESDYGRYQASSFLALKKLVHELRVIAKMKKIQVEDTFTESAADSVQKTAAGVKRLFTDTSGALEGAGQGLNSLFSRAGEAMRSSRSHAEDSAFKQIVGFSKAKRDVAAKFNVDVYSHNQALQSELNRLAGAEYGGGIGVGLTSAVIPGAAGLVVSTSGATRLLNEAINTLPPTELRIKNRQMLVKMGINSDTIELFINNQAFTPREQTYLVGALEAMSKVKNRELYLKVAIQAADRNTAFLLANMALLYTGYNKRVNPIVSLHPFGRILYGLNQKGTKILILPADYVTWNSRLAGAVGDLMAGELWILGVTSPRAETELKKRGWKIHSNSKKFIAP